LNYAKNEQIRSLELFVINEKGEQIGVLDKQSAIKMAIDAELDLVEVSPNAKPPVAKIMSWSKFKYQQQKKKKESKVRKNEQKEMWFKSFIAEGDMNHKIERIKEFLQKKHTVKITIKSKGRVLREQLNKLVAEIMKKLEGSIEPGIEPKYQGRDLTFLVRPTHIIKRKINNEKENTQSDSKTL
jgi:translation initiation factor IF-3